MELATACACELGRHRSWSPLGSLSPRPSVNRWGHFTDENTEAKTSRSCVWPLQAPHWEGKARAAAPWSPHLHRQEPRHLFCPHGWTLFCPRQASRGQDGRERVSAAVTWQVAQPLWAGPPPGLSRGGSACGLARCLGNADLLSLRSTKPSTATCPLHSLAHGALQPTRVPWASDYPHAQLWAAQARGGRAGSTLAHSGAWQLPRPQPPEGPCVVGTSPSAFKPRTETWVAPHGGRQLQRPR